MASKFAGILDALQPAPPELPAYQQKINELKAKIRGEETHTPESLAAEYLKARQLKKSIEDEESIVNARLAALEQMMVESLDADEPGWGMYGAGPTTVKLASGASVAVQYEPVGKVEDKEAFRIWCMTPADVCLTCGGPSDDKQHEASEHACQTCQETDGTDRCGCEAYTLVQPRGRSEGPYWLCPEHASHYLHNRNCEDVTPEDAMKPTHTFTPGGGLERSLQLMYQTTNSITKERLLAGQPAPPGVAAFVRAKVVLRKEKA